MDAVTFAKQVADSRTRASVDRWAERFLEGTALQTMMLVAQLDELPDQLREHYLEVLADILMQLPEDSIVLVSPFIRDTLSKKAPPTMWDVIGPKVDVARAATV